MSCIVSTLLYLVPHKNIFPGKSTIHIVVTLINHSLVSLSPQDQAQNQKCSLIIHCCFQTNSRRTLRGKESTLFPIFSEEHSSQSKFVSHYSSEEGWEQKSLFLIETIRSY